MFNWMEELVRQNTTPDDRLEFWDTGTPVSPGEQSKVSLRPFQRNNGPKDRERRVQDSSSFIHEEYLVVVTARRMILIPVQVSARRQCEGMSMRSFLRRNVLLSTVGVSSSGLFSSKNTTIDVRFMFPKGESMYLRLTKVSRWQALANGSQAVEARTARAGSKMVSGQKDRAARV